MQSTPILLRWFLEHRPPGFPTKLTAPLWSLLSLYLSSNFQTPYTSTAELGLISGIMMAGMEYQQTFCSDSALVGYTAGSLGPFHTIAKCQHLVSFKLFWLNRGVSAELNATPARQQLLHNPAFEYAALLAIAGACQYAYEQNQEEQQRSFGRPTRDRVSGGSSSSSGCRGNSSRRSNRGRGNSSSSSSSSVQSSSAHLVVPPDHELVAAALGKEAVAAHARAAQHTADHLGPAKQIQCYLEVGILVLSGVWGVVMERRMRDRIAAFATSPTATGAEALPAGPYTDSGPAPGPSGAAAAPLAAAAAAAVPAAAAAGVAVGVMAAAGPPAASSPMAHAAAGGVIPCTLVFRLILEASAYAIALEESLNWGLCTLHMPLGLMLLGTEEASLEERRHLMADRGAFFLEVFALMLQAVEKEQQREVADGKGHAWSGMVVGLVLRVLRQFLSGETEREVSRL